VRGEGKLGARAKNLRRRTAAVHTFCALAYLLEMEPAKRPCEEEQPSF